ncbi:MAG: hypothetical protein KDI69_04875 [Xanthomonadales bacterium]|nr:hypothetical protein [Xanthomonadales bacterium]
MLGAAIFLFLVVPYYWSWETIYNRNFSTYERLLTQGRVLCLYLWQMLVPMPSNMPFYYDWLQPSHGLLQPWTTLAALVLLALLLGTAWQLRHRRPLFALGVFLFFAGHFITSNVVNLELAFEHRNHLPLIGIALAIGDVLALLASRVHARTPIVVAVFLLSLGGLASATLIRATSWNSDLHLAETSTRIAPNSTRAWNQLCVAYFNLGGGDRKENSYLDQAIAACDKGAVVGTDSIKTLTNIVAMKAIQGTLTEADWARYLARLRTVTMTPENGSSIWIILNQARDGKPMNANHLLEAIEIVSQRRQVKPIESAAMGYFILGHTPQPDKAYSYFARAVHDAKDPAFITGIIDELRKEGQPEWADKLTAEVRASGRDDVPLATDGDHMP